MSNTQSDSPTHENEIASEREMENITGRVKWFNRKNGYGFITVISEHDEQRDIFVHYENITTSQEQFRYLVEGEYVSFDIGPSSQADHEVEAHNVRGIEGHSLMCETRREQMEKRPPRRQRPRPPQQQNRQHQGQYQGQQNRGRPQQRRYVPKGRVVEVDNTEWMMVPLRTTGGGNRGRGGRGRGRGRGGGGQGRVYQQ